MKLLDIFESRSHPKRLNLVESDQIRIGMSSYDVDFNDQGGRITLDVTQQGMTVAELVYESGEIVWIHVEPWFRKQGLAEAMLEYLRGRGLKVVMPDARTNDGKGFFGAMQQRGKLDEVESIGDLDDSDHALDTQQMKLTPGAKPVARFGDVDLYQDDPQHFEFFQGERPVGFAHGHRGPHPDLGNWITIGLIWLDPSVRQKGIGIQFYEWLLGQDLVVISDTHQSDTVQVVWEKLVQKYEAALLHDGAVAKMITSYSELRDGYDVYSDEDETEVTIAVFPRRRTTPLLAESLIEDDGEFDWTKPTTFYRGIVDPTHAEQPFTGTRRGVPTFTDDWSVANTYARHPNDLTRDAGKSDQVYAYRLNIRNPIHLNVGREDVTEANYILKTLGATTVGEGWELFRQLLDIISWRANGETWFTDEYSGVEFPVEIEGWGDNPTDTYGNLNHVFVEHWNHNWPGLYCTSFELADNQVFQNMVRAAGYDGIVYYGHTSTEWDGNILTGTSFDGTHAMEWRALDPSQVEYLGPAGRPPRLTEAGSLTKAVEYKLNGRSNQRVEFTFTHKGVGYAVGFSRLEAKISEFIFQPTPTQSGPPVNQWWASLYTLSSTNNTTYSDALVVFSTALKIVADFIHQHGAELVNFATNGVRGRLYKKLIPGFAKQNGLNYELVNDDSHVVINLTSATNGPRVTEALNSPVRFNISHNSDSHNANYNFSYNGEEFRVGFKESGEFWNVVFVNVNQDLPFDPTGLGGGIPVLSTVIAIVKDFITLYPQVKTLRFSGENHNGLADLYRQMVRTLSKRLGIRFEEDRLQYQSQFLVHLRESLSSVPTHTPKQIATKHGVDPSVITKQLAKGIKIEHEHTTSQSEARQIALDHLWELPDYYDRLGSMERQAGLSEGPAVPLRVTPRMIARAKDNKCQIIVEMPIQQFLDMTTPDQPAQQRIASNSKSILDYNRWAKMANDPAVAKRFNDQRQQTHTGEEPYETEYGNDLMPFLLIRLNNNGSSGWVVGHEGRHRGSASMKAGAKTMQVSLRIYPGEDMFPDQYSPDYFITQEHLPSHLVGQFNKDVYPTGGWKIIDGDLQKRTRERILR